MYPSSGNTQKLQAEYESQLIVWFLSLLQYKFLNLGFKQ